MNTKQMAKVLKALSNENRLKLYLEIMKNHEARYDAGNEKGCFISDLACSFKIGAPTVSHHLKELVNAGLIITERSGKFLVARINSETIEGVAKLLSIKKAGK